MSPSVKTYFSGQKLSTSSENVWSSSCIFEAEEDWEELNEIFT